MTMWYNLTMVSGNNGALGFIQTVDQNLFFHLFGTFTLITLFVIIFRAVVGYNGNPKVTMLYTSFFIAVLGILFKLLSFVPDSVVFIAIGIFVLAIPAQFLLD